MENLWNERNTVGMYGLIRGISDAKLPEIPALSVEDVANLLEAKARMSKCL